MNLGNGHTTLIRELANLVKVVIQCHGRIIYDTDKPDGMKIRCLDTSKANGLGIKIEDD